jgi:hypothetical protein
MLRNEDVLVERKAIEWRVRSRYDGLEYTGTTPVRDLKEAVHTLKDWEVDHCFMGFARKLTCAVLHGEETDTPLLLDTTLGAVFGYYYPKGFTEKEEKILKLAINRRDPRLDRRH